MTERSNHVAHQRFAPQKVPHLTLSRRTGEGIKGDDSEKIRSPSATLGMTEKKSAAGVTPAPSVNAALRCRAQPLPQARAGSGAGDEVASFQNIEDVRQAGVDDVALVGEPAMLHHAARRPVVRQGEGNDSIQAHHVEAQLQRRD